MFGGRLSLFVLFGFGLLSGCFAFTFVRLASVLIRFCLGCSVSVATFLVDWFGWLLLIAVCCYLHV